MDMTKLPLLRKVLEHVSAHPDEHDQDYWGHRTDCGTTRCIAGWTTYFSGYQETDWGPLLWAGGDGLSAVEKDGRTTSVAWAAQTLLGLSYEEADELFYAENLTEVWGIVERITGGALTRDDIEAGVR
jgi:hypothetical protein